MTVTRLDCANTRLFSDMIVPIHDCVQTGLCPHMTVTRLDCAYMTVPRYIRAPTRIVARQDHAHMGNNINLYPLDYS